MLNANRLVELVALSLTDKALFMFFPHVNEQLVVSKETIVAELAQWVDTTLYAISGGVVIVACGLCFLGHGWKVNKEIGDGV